MIELFRPLERLCLLWTRYGPGFHDNQHHTNMVPLLLSTLRVTISQKAKCRVPLAETQVHP